MSLPHPQAIAQEANPPVPQGLVVAPSPQALVQGRREGAYWWTVLRKVTYGLGDDGQLHRVGAQEPIHGEPTPHDPLPDWLGALAGRSGSMKTVPETRAFQSGTDVIVRGHASSATPVPTMLVGVAVGRQIHKLRVHGLRRTVFDQGRVRFTAPEPFQRLPLRSELAYGGFDAHAMQQALCLLEQTMPADDWRRSRAFYQDVVPKTVPIAYARNPVGTGYVADPTPESLHDVVLPCMEHERDLLTPERFAQGQPLDWLARPVPAGMDYMDLRMFPRTALFGLPPPSFEVGSRVCQEVEWGQLPADFSRGNLLTAAVQAISEVIHPDAMRCAPIGLRMPRLQGRETLSLIGLRADLPRWDCCLPGEHPVFEVPGQGVLRSGLWQVFVDADLRRVELLWGASWLQGRELEPGEAPVVLAQIRTHARALEG